MAFWQNPSNNKQNFVPKQQFFVLQQNFVHFIHRQNINFALKTYIYIF